MSQYSSIPGAGHSDVGIQRETIWLWLIVIMGALVRLYRLDYQSLWLDEGWQYSIASAQSLRDVLARSLEPSAAHPPLSYLINHLFLQVHDSDFLFRLPSVLFGIGSLPLCYLVARRLASPAAAVWAVVVLALSPLHLWYSQEARMYAQLVFLSLLSTLFLCKALERAHKKWWVLYVLTVTAGMYTHLFMAFSIITHGIWIARHYRDHLLSYGISLAAVGTCFVVPLSHFLWQGYKTFNKPSGGAGFTWGALPYTLFTYAAGFSLGPNIAELHEDRSLSFIVQFLPSILAVGTVFGTLFISGVCRALKYRDTQYLALCLLSLCFPLAGVVIFSLGPRFTFNVRYTVIALPYFCIFIGIALSYAYTRKNLVGMALVLAFFVISSISLYNYFSNAWYAKEDVRSAVRLFQKTAQENEKILSFNEKYTVDRYLSESEKYRHFSLRDSLNVAEYINEFFSIHGISHVYLLLARDWNKVVETEIYNAFSVSDTEEFNGVKMLKIYKR